MTKLFRYKNPEGFMLRGKLVFIVIPILCVFCSVSLVVTILALSKIQMLENSIKSIESRIEDISAVCPCESETNTLGRTTLPEASTTSSLFMDTTEFGQGINKESTSSLVSSENILGGNTSKEKDIYMPSEEKSDLSTRNGNKPRSTLNRQTRNTRPNGRQGHHVAAASFTLRERKNQYYNLTGKTFGPWVGVNLSRNRLFSLNNIGDTVTISKRGLYFLYSQVTFHNTAPHNIAAIDVNGESVAECTQASAVVDSSSSGSFTNCFTATVRYLEVRNTVTIKSLYENRQIFVRRANTFFGLVRLN